MSLHDDFLNKLISATINGNISWTYEEYEKMYEDDKDHEMKRYRTILFGGHIVDLSLQNIIYILDKDNNIINIIMKPIEKINELQKHIINSRKLEKIIKFLSF